MTEKSKFRLKDFDRKIQVSSEDAVYAAYISAKLLKPIPKSLKAYRDPYLLEEFYKYVIETEKQVPVKTAEFEDEFYFEDLDSALSSLLRIFRFGRKKRGKTK